MVLTFDLTFSFRFSVLFQWRFLFFLVILEDQSFITSHFFPPKGQVLPAVLLKNQSKFIV